MFMLRSEQIKSEIDRSTAEVEALNKLLEDRIAASRVQHRKIKHILSDFTAQERSALEFATRTGEQKAKDAFSKKRAEVRNVIESFKGLTFAPWSAPAWSFFNIEKDHPSQNCTRIGQFSYKEENDSLDFPAIFPILGGKNIMLRATGAGRQKARSILRNVAFRLLTSLPPGKLRFVFIDPVELGSIAAGLVGALPDFLTGGIAWHQEQDIEDQLSLMETRIAAIKTKCLGINFSSLDQYNSDPKTKIKEPYWLVVISDCPVRFRDTSLQRLLSIAKNGPQAGVHLAILLDDGQKKCTDSLIGELAETAHHIVCPDHDGTVYYDDPDYLKCELCIDEVPSSELMGRVTEQISKTALSAQTVRVEWEPPATENWWKGDSRHGVKTPLGIFGARETQFFEIDEKLLNSALIIGKPGSGKSRLLHVLVSGLATYYSPDEVSLYLLDCKQVEFKDYATHKLPHARVVAIESEREFGLSVLRKLGDELDRRKNLFSSAGETSLSSYRNKVGPERSLPRIILVIDEFQELLYDDTLGREAAVIRVLIIVDVEGPIPTK